MFAKPQPKADLYRLYRKELANLFVGVDRESFTQATRNNNFYTNSFGENQFTVLFQSHITF